MHLFNKNVVGSAQKQIDIDGVRDGILMLTNNKFCCVVETSAVNFELKSDSEQDALIDIYRSFLNSLGGPIQIIIRTREIDLDNYLMEIESKALKELDIYQQQLKKYVQYIKGLVNVNKILTRSFYVVIPLCPLIKQDYDLVKEQLTLRTDIVIKGLQRLGMHARLLPSLELLNLFYVFYNPKLAKIEPLSDSALRIMHAALIKQDLGDD